MPYACVSHVTCARRTSYTIQCARLLPWKMKWIEFGREACMISCRTESHALLDTLTTDRHVGLHVHNACHQVHAQALRAVDRETTRTHVDRHVHTYIMQSCQCSAVHVRVNMHCRSVWHMGACTAWHYRAQSKKRRCRNGRRWILELFSMLAHSSKLVRLETYCI